MKITRKDLEDKYYFHMLSLGDLFEHDGYVMIKMDPVRENGSTYTAVNLADGDTIMMENQDEVTPLNGELIIYRGD